MGELIETLHVSKFIRILLNFLLNMHCIDLIRNIELIALNLSIARHFSFHVSRCEKDLLCLIYVDT